MDNRRALKQAWNDLTWVRKRFKGVFELMEVFPSFESLEQNVAEKEQVLKALDIEMEKKTDILKKMEGEFNSRISDMEVDLQKAEQDHVKKIQAAQKEANEKAAAIKAEFKKVEDTHKKKVEDLKKQALALDDKIEGLWKEANKAEDKYNKFKSQIEELKNKI